MAKGDAPEVDKDLAKLLKLAKKKALNFAVIAKGADVVKLILSKKPIQPGAIADAKKESGGKIVVRGVVRGDDAEHVFQVTEDSPVGENKLKAYISDATKLKLKPRFEVNAALQEINDDTADGDDDDDNEAGPVSKPDASGKPVLPSVDPMAMFNSRLAGLMPSIKTAIATTAPLAKDIKLKASEAGVAANKKDFVHGNQLLDELEVLLKQFAQPDASSSPTNQMALFKDRLKVMLPGIREAVSSDAAAGKTIQTKTSEAGESANKNDFVKANQLLDEAEQLLKKVIGGSGNGTPGGLSLVKLGRARLEWDKARLHCVSELERLKGILQEEYESDADEEDTLKLAHTRLNDMIRTMNEELGNRLDEVLNADPQARPKLIVTAKSVLKKFIDFVATDEILSAIDGNEYAADMVVADPLSAKLQDIAASLG